MKHLSGIILLFTWIITGCNNEVGGNYQIKPPAMGRMNEVVAIADEDLWNSMVKDSFMYYFESAYPILPQPEPMFDVRHFTTKDLDIEVLRKELRTYVVLANLQDMDSPTTQMVRKDLGEEKFIQAKQGQGFTSSVGRDKWAKGQIIIYLFANGLDALTETIRTHYPAIAKRVHAHDKEQLDASVYVMKNPNLGLAKVLQKTYGLRFLIPNSFVQVMEKPEDQFVWLRHETRDATQSITIRKIPYEGEEQFSKDFLVNLRDEYGKKYISSTEANSYMVTNTIDLPIYEYRYDIDGLYTYEIRGIWEMENDFMGGPYASYLIHNKQTNELVFIDAFVYAPGEDKRNLMQQLEHIVKRTTQS